MIAGRSKGDGLHRDTVKDVKVLVEDANGKPVASRIDLPDGWHALPLDKKE